MELGGFGLEVLILFGSGLEAKEHYFDGDRERIVLIRRVMLKVN